jgi:hypothetical protein
MSLERKKRHTHLEREKVISSCISGWLPKCLSIPFGPTHARNCLGLHELAKLSRQQVKKLQKSQIIPVEAGGLFTDEAA